MFKNLALHYIFIVCFIYFVNAASDKYITEHPDYLKGCQIKKPGFTNCSTVSIQGLFHELDKGIPGLDVIPTFDPFLLNKIKISQGNSNVMNIKVELTKSKVHGFGKTIVQESKVSPKDYSWKTTILLPTMKIESDYSLQGRILLIPLNGRGKMQIEIENMNVIMYTKTKLYTKGGLTFYNVTNIKVDYTITGLKAYFSNLFNGNKYLEDSTNQFFNDNWEMLAEALRPVITQTIEDILLDILQKVFHYVPAEFFVTDIPTPEELYGKADKDQDGKPKVSEKSEKAIEAP